MHTDPRAARPLCCSGRRLCVFGLSFESINIPASNEHFDTMSLATIWALGHAADRADVAPLPWS